MQITCRLCCLMTCHVVGGREQRGEREQILQKCKSCPALKTSVLTYKLWIILLPHPPPPPMKLPCWISSLGWFQISGLVVLAAYSPGAQGSLTLHQEVVGDLRLGPSGIWYQSKHWGLEVLASAVDNKGFIGNKDKLVAWISAPALRSPMYPASWSCWKLYTCL